MPDATIRTGVRSQGGGDLRVISRELRDMDDRKVKDLFKSRLTDAARPFVPAVRASVLAIPTTGKKHTGLRARIAACAQVASWESGVRQVSVAVEMDPKRMPPRELSLPLMMQGAKRWRHPVYGNRENWVLQAPHPFFFQAASGFGRAAEAALGKALDDITKQLNG